MTLGGEEGTQIGQGGISRNGKVKLTPLLHAVLLVTWFWPWPDGRGGSAAAPALCISPVFAQPWTL